MEKYSAIIPIYNEASRVSDVLTAIERCPEVSEIICIDDGSDDGSYELIRNNFPSITLIKHERNKGKSEAILTGLKIARSDGILLLDSDIIGLKAEEISGAIRIFEKNNLDCLLLSTKPSYFIDYLVRVFLRAPLVVAGNRIIKKEDLMNIFREKMPKSYQLEIAQNIYFLNNSKKVAKLDISAINYWKVRKRGIIKGVISDFKMWKGIVEYAGWRMFIKQTLLFAKDKVFIDNKYE